ncbi:hypothetical protein [Inquilinus limosus]|uniref:Uncharacterized protein n=1 Tax=Inquilinus limosus TaxID=171674 RepID=A0A211Z826_9PROT|nr:hypothetical protein [Inquilinus limosus]OWJ61386.1 hypothetical protein BWR60_31180 [Inquilinus limosus]
MAADDLVRREEFFYADCVLTPDSRIIGFSVSDGAFVIGEDLSTDDLDTTDIFGNFRIEIDGALYVGGEASAHGSCGFFYKMTGGHVDWALISLESEPFVGVERCDGGVRFLAASGAAWIVRGDDVTRIHIQPGPGGR